jgi:hypothetical protein
MISISYSIFLYAVFMKFTGCGLFFCNLPLTKTFYLQQGGDYEKYPILILHIESGILAGKGRE